MHAHFRSLISNLQNSCGDIGDEAATEIEKLLSALEKIEDHHGFTEDWRNIARLALRPDETPNAVLSSTD